MSRAFWPHLIYLFLAALGTFFWTHHPEFSYYNLQFTAILIIFYFSKNFLFKNALGSTAKAIDALVLTMIICGLVFSSGGPSSPYFFLIYFLLFGLSFTFEPAISLGFSLVMILIFLFYFESQDSLISLFSLVLISPLSYFLGEAYLKNLQEQKRIKVYQSQWLKNEKILENQETDVLIWLSLNFRSALTEILQKASLLLSELPKLSTAQKTHLKRIRRKAKELLETGELLERKVDSQTDEKN